MQYINYIKNISVINIRIVLIFAIISLIAASIKAQTSETFTTPGSNLWIAPAGVTTVTIECWGAGGAGGNTGGNSGGSGGGGGGAYSQTTSIAVIPGNSYLVYVGNGGVQGINSGNGEDSYFINTSTILAKGGSGGSDGPGGTGGTGGLASSGIGTTKYSGGNGGDGNTFNKGCGGGGGSSAGNASGGVAGSNATASSPGSGGIAPTGGGNGGDGGDRANGLPGSQPGGAGGGSGEGATGGDGADGQVIITYASPNCPSSTTVSPSTQQTICQNEATNLLTANTTLSGGTGTPTILYQWYYNLSNTNTITGATKISGATSQTYTPSSSTAGAFYYFCVSYATNNNCNQTDETQSLASNVVEVTINALPSAVIVSGGGTFCESTTLNASGGTGGTIYWQNTTSEGTSTTNPSTSEIVTSSGTYYFRAMSADGCWGTEGSATVTINPNPTISLGSDPTICQGITTADLTYTGTTGSPDQYSIDYDATAEVQGFVDVVNATLSASPIVLIVPAGATPDTYNYVVTVRNSTTGCVSSSYPKTITIDPPTPSTPGAISGLSTVNPSLPGLVYSISAVPFATLYNWAVPTGWTITDGQGTTSITVTSGTLGQNGNISVTASNSCGTSAPSTLLVTVFNSNCPQSTDVAPTATQTVCQGVTTDQLTATITLSGGGGSPTLLYQWYYNTSNSNTISGATKLAGETASTYTPDNTTIGTRYYFCVGYATDNGCSQGDDTQFLASNTVQVSIDPSSPVTPGAITGSDIVGPNASGLIYSISAVTYASSYTWTVPTGWIINSGQGTTSVSVTSGSVGQNGDITVTADNSCGTSSPSTLAVSVSIVPPTITLSTSYVNVCLGTTSADLPYSGTSSSPDLYSIDYYSYANTQGFIDVVDAALPASPIILTIPSSPPTGNYFANLSVKNSSSGLSSSYYSFYVKVIDTPVSPGPITGLSVVSENVPETYSCSNVSYATTYTWTVPTGWIITDGQGTIKITVLTGSAGQNGDVSVTAGNSCGTSAATVLAVSAVIPTDHTTYGCNSCHLFHNSPGVALTNISGNDNLCMTCHVSGGVASAKAISAAMIAVPGVSGTSHAWNVPAVNATRETRVPVNFPEMANRLDNGNIICSTCHNQHNPNTFGNYLRASNTGDLLCKDCHAARNVGRYIDDPSNNKGSHPVGLTYPSSSDYLATPTSPLTIPDGKIECSSCHQTHYATTTDGNLLVVTGDNNMCTSCHTFGTHNGTSCLDCHQTHNTNKSNIYMIRDVVATPNSGDKTVIFTALTGNNSFADGDGTYDGICEVCHTNNSNNYHYNTSAGDHTHEAGNNCTSCHTHSDNFGQPNCNSCHDVIPGHTTNAHNKHTVGLYTYNCSTCHLNYGSGGSLEGSHPNGTVNINFNPNGMATRNGLDANTPQWNSGTKTCDNIYCHSNGRSAYRGTDGTYTWSGTTGSQTATYATTPSWATGTITVCLDCHSGTGNMTDPYTITTPGLSDPLPPATGSHRRGVHVSNSQELSGNGWTVVNCFWCHNASNGDDGSPIYQGTYGTSFHVDGQTYFDPRSVVDGGTMVNNGSGGSFSYSLLGSAAHCGDGKTCW